MKKIAIGITAGTLATLCLGATIDVWLLSEVTSPDASTDVLPLVKTGGSAGAGRKITVRHLAEWVLAITHPHTKFVDASNASGGVFANLPDAIAAASSGDKIEILSDLTISAYATIGTTISIDGNGRKLIASSEGSPVVMLRATVAGIKINNLELSCGRVSSNTIVNSGHIEVAASDFEIRNSYIHDGVGIGVRLMQGADRARISNNRLSTLGSGIIAQGSSGAGPSNLIIDHNRVENMIDAANSKGIYVGTPDGVIVSSDIDIDGNTVINCGGSDIEIWRVHSNARVVNNHTIGAVFGISLDGCLNSVISGNQVAAATSYGIEIPNGCNRVVVSGNDIDGRVSGTPTMLAGVSISNNIQSVDLSVSGNTVRGFTVTGIGGSNFSGLIASGNSLTQEYSGAVAFQLKDVVHSSVIGNIIRITSGDAPVVVDSTDLACNDVTIGNNKFIGVPSSKLIALFGNVHNISNITITENTAFDCTFLASGFINYATASGGVISGVFRSGNLPERTTLANNQSGWDNDRFQGLGIDAHLSIGTSASATNPSYRLYDGATLEGDFALAEGSGAYATGAAVNDVVVRSIDGAIWIDATGNKPINLSVNDALAVSINPSGDITFKHLADTSATNDSTYYSTTQSKLVYKDSGGTVHVLY